MKKFAIDGTGNAPRGIEPVQASGREQRLISAIIIGHPVDHALSRRGPAIPADHRQVDARCIDAFHTLDIEPLDGLLECGAERLDACRVALRSMERLCLSGSFRRCKARQMVAGLTRGPCAATTRARNAAKVAAGCLATSVRRSSRWSVRVHCRPPAWGFAVLLPLWRHRCQSFSTNEPLTQKRSAIACCVAVLASSAWMIRSRRS